MSDNPLMEALNRLCSAAYAVEEAWEQGDLAGAVTDLMDAVYQASSLIEPREHDQ